MATKREKERGQKRQVRHLVNREADAIDRILDILWDVSMHSGWRGVRRVLFYILLMNWESLAKRVEMGEFGNG
jgi:hypothetical protein